MEFQEYAKEKYLIEDENVLRNQTLLQMMYALEWFDIPRSSRYELVEFHPYLMKSDLGKLDELRG